ncbi:MAG: hypothetical protein ACHQAX_05295 [Gammaproteobacteria bacterium]
MSQQRVNESISIFTVDENTFELLQKLFDKPLPTTDKLRRLLKTKAPWEE